jgi:LysM repeat protein
VGPFDANGNYVEAWADDPSKWRAYKPKDIDGDPPAIARNEQPPDHSVPLVTGGPPTDTRTLPTKPVTSSPRPTPDSDHVASRSTTKPRTSSTSSKPKPKTTVAKSKPKPKPSVVRHTVKKGDSLSSLAAKYGSSISAIKSANNISGTMIRDGKTLIIPKKK